MTGWLRPLITLTGAATLVSGVAVAPLAVGFVAFVIVSGVAWGWPDLAALSRRGTVVGTIVGVGLVAIVTMLVAPTTHLIGYLTVIGAAGALVSFAWLVFLPDYPSRAVERTAGLLGGVGLAIAGAAWVGAAADSAVTLIIATMVALAVAAIATGVITHPVGMAVAPILGAVAGAAVAAVAAGAGNVLPATVAGLVAGLVVVITSRIDAGTDAPASRASLIGGALIPVLAAGPIPLVLTAIWI